MKKIGFLTFNNTGRIFTAVIVIFSVPFFVVNALLFSRYTLWETLLGVATVTVLQVLFFELCFRASWRFFHKEKYVKRNFSFDEIPIEPHPYIPSVYKKNAFLPANYTKLLFNREKNYKLYGVRTNSMRVANGPKGDREIVVPKPKELIRVNCLGESTTASYIQYKDEFYSYPVELEKILQEKFPQKKIEVNNFAQGNWSSVEILINFLLHVYETEPDIVVLYCGFNDIPIILKDAVMPDYTHAKTSLAGRYRDMMRMSQFPNIPLSLYNFIISQAYSGIAKHLENFNFLTETGNVNLDNSFEGLAFFKRNVEHLLKVCTESGIDVVLSTHPHFLNKFNRKLKSVLKYREGLEIENELIRNLTKEYNVALADFDREVPREVKYYLDSMHPSHLGMSLLAEITAKPVEKFISQR